jgi:hypothetical protein
MSNIDDEARSTVKYKGQFWPFLIGGDLMKYFFASDKKGKRHIIVANDLLEAKSFGEFNDIYELKEDTFNNPGFLISD